MITLGILALIGAITVSAIFHYKSVDDALKFWSALSGLVGVVTGVVATYFFTRGTVQAATQGTEALKGVAEKAQDLSDDQQRNVKDLQRQLQEARTALASTMNLINDQNLSENLRQDPAVRVALE